MNASTARLAVAPPTILTAAPVPGAQPTPPDRERAGPPARPFSELLRQNRLHAAVGDRPAPPPIARPVRPDANGEAAAAAAQQTAARASAANGKGTAAKASDESATAPSTEAAAADADAPVDDEAAATVGDDDETARDAGGRTSPADAAARSAAFASPQRPAAERLAAADADVGQAETGDAAGATPRSRAIGQADEHRSERAEASTARPAAETRAGREPAALSAAAAGFATAFDELRGSARPHGTGELGASALAALGGSTAVVDSAAGSAAAPTQATLATPLDSPDFAAAFGLQVSLLAEGGVQHAELHLNPAEMGPVSVRIALEGTQARIDFGADFAATRQAIEAGLPELAGALRDAGFTLSGGGVSQHAGSRWGGADEGGRNAGRSDAASPTRSSAAEPVRLLRRTGGVDLYA